MTSPDVFVTISSFGSVSEAPLKRLEYSGFSFAVNDLGRRMIPEEILERARESKGLIAGLERYDEDTLRSFADLKCISRSGTGVDNIDLKAAAAEGITVLNTPDAPTQAVAELTLGMMLALLRSLNSLDAGMRAGEWQRITGHLLQGRVVGIVGLGRIGRRVAELLKVFGVHLLGFDPIPPHAWSKHLPITLLPLEELLAKSDVVTIHAAVQGESPLFFDAETFRRMKPGAWFLNLARGSLVNDGDLAAALQSGHLSGAALDVFPVEPYEGPLTKAPNTILTPHQATLTYETRAEMEAEAVENLLNFLDSSHA
jgi:D-3-phosphoglycerate dehydrogenase